MVVLANVTAAALVTLAVWRWPDWFARLVTVPRALPLAVVVLPAALAGGDDDRRAGPGVPRPGHAAGARPGDGRPVHRPGAVRLVSGQSPADFADRAEGLAHGFRAHMCRVRGGVPGMVVLELVRRDALAEPMPALPVPEETDLRALPVGRCEDGASFLIRLHGTHLLIAGATGAGKGSYLWCLVRAMLPAMAAGLVRVLGL